MRRGGAHQGAGKRKAFGVRRLWRTVLLLGLLGGLGGCETPGYGPDYPVYGYAPYAYVWPLYVDGYAPVFIVHHPWEAHHAYGHPGNFFHGFAGRPLGAHAGGRFR